MSIDEALDTDDRITESRDLQCGSNDVYDAFMVCMYDAFMVCILIFFRIYFIV